MVKQINTLHTKGFTRRSKVTKILGISISSLLPDIERLFASSDIAFLSIHFPFSNQANMPWIRDARVFRLEKAEKSARQPSAESIQELIRDASGRRAYSPDCCVLRAPRLVSIFFLRLLSSFFAFHGKRRPIAINFLARMRLCAGQLAWAASASSARRASLVDWNRVKNCRWIDWTP